MGVPNLFGEDDIIEKEIEEEIIADSKEGIFYGMLNNTYHGAEGISSTQFQDLDLSVSVFNNRHIFNCDKGCYKVGDLNHVALLEADKLDMFMESTTIGFETIATKKMIIENPNKTIIPKGSTELAKERAKKVYLIFHKHLKSSKKEVSIIVWDESIQMYRKARTDIWLQKEGIILDYKTSKEDTVKGFENSIEKYNYHLSAAWYMDTVNIAIEKFKLPFEKITSFGWIVSPHTEPHKPFGLICSQELLEKGREKYSHRLNKLIQVNQNGENDLLFHEAHSWEFRKNN